METTLTSEEALNMIYQALNSFMETQNQNTQIMIALLAFTALFSLITMFYIVSQSYRK